MDAPLSQSPRIDVMKGESTDDVLKSFFFYIFSLFPLFSHCTYDIPGGDESGQPPMGVLQ